MDSSKKTLLAFTALLSLLFGAGGGALSTAYVLSNQPEQERGETIINFENGSYREVWETAAPAVVSVVALKDLSDFYDQFSFFGLPGQERKPKTDQDTGDEQGQLSEVSSGTGFIVTADGLVVTNKHVVEDDTAQYVVILNDGTELNAEILDKDTLNDIAIIQITGDDERIGDLPTLEFGDSDLISVGDPVIAIGNALGEYSNTTTVGIVSAIGREIIAAGGMSGSESLVNLIQTDAAINPGNSGGPLLNLAGEVIGMNTAVDITAAGLGFALPSNDVAMVLKSYQEFGRIVRPFVGVRYVVVQPGLQKRLELSVDHGVYLIGDAAAGEPAVVEGSPADKAGLQEGDIILSVEGVDLSSTYTLSNAIAGYLVGETITLEIWRDGKTLSVGLTLVESVQ